MKKRNTENYCLHLEGQRFGRLVVRQRAEDKIDPKTGKHRSRWLCDCDCGGETIVDGRSLTSGSTKSCGCLHREVSSITAKTRISHGKKYNTYDLSGEYGIGYTTKGREFYFDLEDYDKIKDICWQIGTRGYVQGHIVGDNRHCIVMHRYILGVTNPNIVVDHKISERKNDNRKENLRITTQDNNTRNHKISRNNTSGITGVSWNKRQNKWQAYIRYNNKQICLGYYKDMNMAANIRKQAEIQYYGEFRYKGEEYLARRPRTSIFENSKSNVQLWINPEGLEDNKLTMKDGYVIVDFGRYGMDYKTYESQNDKLSYIITELFYLNGEKREGIEDMDQFKKIKSIIQEYDPSVLGIKISDAVIPFMDHKMIPQNEESNFVRYRRPSTIKDYLFNKFCCFKTDCY